MNKHTIIMPNNNKLLKVGLKVLHILLIMNHETPNKVLHRGKDIRKSLTSYTHNLTPLRMNELQYMFKKVSINNSDR